MDDDFARLQSRLADVWPALTLRSPLCNGEDDIVVHSLSDDPPAHLAPVLPAYEERFLCLVLGLLRAPESRVVYVISQPVLPRIVAAKSAKLNPRAYRLTFHDLRHSYGLHLALSGLDPVGVQRQLGHARPSITMDLYVHEFESARRRDQVATMISLI